MWTRSTADAFGGLGDVDCPYWIPSNPVVPSEGHWRHCYVGATKVQSYLLRRDDLSPRVGQSFGMNRFCEAKALGDDDATLPSSSPGSSPTQPSITSSPT